jgi:hypothetical protein
VSSKQQLGGRILFLGDDVTFESIGLTLPVETIYQRVKNQDVLDYLTQKAQQTEIKTCQ